MFGLTRRNQNITTYNPWRELEELERAFFERPFFRTAPLSQFRTDVTDLGENYLLEADLPGFDKKDITLQLSGDTLTICAQRKADSEKADDKGQVIYRERSCGSYRRSFDISGIDAEGIKARYENGVLRLTLPKQETQLPKTKQLEIE